MEFRALLADCKCYKNYTTTTRPTDVFVERSLQKRLHELSRDTKTCPLFKELFVPRYKNGHRSAVVKTMLVVDRNLSPERVAFVAANVPLLCVGGF